MASILRCAVLSLVGVLLVALALADTEDAARPVLKGRAAMGDWTTDAPGVRRLITLADLPKPFATRSVDRGPRLVRRPANAWPKAPPGFVVELLADRLDNPRKVIAAPNGDLSRRPVELGRRQ
jgi:hypothetical protein